VEYMGRYNMSEKTKEYGKEISTAFFVCGGREKSKDEFMSSGRGAAYLLYDNEQDITDFAHGWQQAWEDNMLMVELLSEDDPTLAECTRIADKRRLVVERQIFRRARLGIGARDGGYDNVWDYSSPESALIAMESWCADDPEPQGWHRHHSTGRYRINGKRELEWVKDDGSVSLEQNITFAIQVTKGKDKSIGEIVESSEHIGSEMPIGTQCFTVASEGIYTWIVYHRWDRCVVLSVDELGSVRLGSVIERLKGD